MRPSPRQQRERSPVLNTWEDSGFRWGAFDLRGERPWSLRITQHGGSVIYPYPVTPGQKQSQHVRSCAAGSIIVKGNWREDHSHPKQYEHLDSYYWDNPLLPQLITEPRPTKATDWWCRLVYGGPFPGRYLGGDAELLKRERAVNEMLQQLGQASSWRDLITVNDFGWESNTVVWLRPHSEVLEWYYGETRDTVEQRLRDRCLEFGYTFEVRPKPSRPQRFGSHSLYEYCRQRRPRCVVGVHTAAAAEVLAAGTEFVAIGQTAFEGMTTSLAKIRANYPPPSKEQVLRRCRELLLTTRNKGLELLEGQWSLDLYERLFERQTRWHIEIQ